MVAIVTIVLIAVNGVSIMSDLDDVKRFLVDRTGLADVTADVANS